MSKNSALIVAGIIFSLVALCHLVRVLLHISITVAGHSIPMTTSYVGLIVALLLAIWMFVASRK